MQITSATTPQKRGEIFTIVLWGLISYFAVSCLTLPLVNWFWLGEIPILAIIQLPKIEVASWLRTAVVMKTITFLGFSSGSFSPDYALARPFALAIAYLIPVVIFGSIGLLRVRNSTSRRSLVLIIFLLSSALDYAITLIYAARGLLTIY